MGPALLSSVLGQQMEPAPPSHKKLDEKWAGDAQTGLGCSAQKTQ